ncbi:GbsR/MarR family transcriptional regulator [Martelella lutilitoris]|uniref:HTH-type transcriptional regulator n=1 Tax=Martelella lutilitoris TaxID=2583532 RepID=A0A5C4JTI5_9HYPH|nr:GbsR/MarR family transcriptional regulator [Martelella lutilitoris]TNB48637.1 GbsR/MarR family transcriptional regulator [Martelella lutilitoris]
MTMSPIVQDFVLHFGEMGSRWGINRSVGQIYALLYASREPLCADDMVNELKISRSNVAAGLKELQSWGLVLLRHRPGDRRDYYTTPEDVWSILRTLAEERKKREVDPTLALLAEVTTRTPRDEDEEYAQKRMGEMHDLIARLSSWYDDVKGLETERLLMLLGMGARVTRLLETADKMTSFGRKAGRDQEEKV